MIGLGWRRPIASDLLRDTTLVDFVEVIADNVRDDRELRALSKVWPIFVHGVKVSLGSVDGFDENRAREYGKLARRIGAPFVSEHISFVRASGIEIGHLTQLPRTVEAARVVAANARKAAKLAKVPIVLENVAWSVRCRDELDEAAFVRAVLDECECGLLLDVANLWANAKNEGLDPFAVIDAYPVERIAQIHVAGSLVEDGFVFDTHAHSVHDEVLALLAHVLARIGPARAASTPVLLERDRGFDWEDHVRELQRLRSPSRAVPPRAQFPFQPSTEPRRELSSRGRGEVAELGEVQRSLALALTEPRADRSVPTPPRAQSCPWSSETPNLDPAQLDRARVILARKRDEERASS
jgi:uncharacterized protein (UPF0276 family)